MEKDKLLIAFQALTLEKKQEFLTAAQEELEYHILSDAHLSLVDYPLVYLKEDGTKEVLPELVISRKFKITGIVCGGKEVSLFHEKKRHWLRATEAAEKAKATLISPELFKEKDKFNAVVHLLNYYGVKAEKWYEDNCYWCVGELDKYRHAIVVDMSGGGVGRGDIWNSNTYVRFVWDLPA